MFNQEVEKRSSQISLLQGNNLPVANQAIQEDLVEPRSSIIGQEALKNIPTPAVDKNSSQSLVSRQWKCIKSFLSLVGLKLSRIFQRIFGRLSSKEKNDFPTQIFLAHEKSSTEASGFSGEGFSPLKTFPTVTRGVIQEELHKEEVLKKVDGVQKEDDIPKKADVYGIKKINDTFNSLENELNEMFAFVDSLESSYENIDVFYLVKSQLEQKKEQFKDFEHTLLKDRLQGISTLIEILNDKIINKLASFDENFDKKDKKNIFEEKEDYKFFDDFEEDLGIPLFPTEKHSVDSHKPIGIKNNGVCCYRNSSIQALRVLQPLNTLIRTPLANSVINYETRERVRLLLVTLLDAMEQEKSAKEIKTAEIALRDFIFHSDFNQNEFNPETKGKQQDAASYLEIILAQVLNYQYVEQPINKGILHEISYSKKIPAGPLPIMQVPILKGAKKLQDLVDVLYTETKEENWNFEGKFFETYTKTVKIEGAPKDVMVIQLKRGVRQNTLFLAADINNAFIEIPNGIIDFSYAHNRPRGELQYEVKSFIRLHAQNGAGGHYTSYVKKGEQWYHCNDTSVVRVSKEKAERAMSKAYIYFFERIKPHN